MTRNSLQKGGDERKSGRGEVNRARDLLSNVTLLFSEKYRRDKRRQKRSQASQRHTKRGKTATEHTCKVKRRTMFPTKPEREEGKIGDGDGC